MRTAVAIALLGIFVTTTACDLRRDRAVLRLACMANHPAGRAQA